MWGRGKSARIVDLKRLHEKHGISLNPRGLVTESKANWHAVQMIMQQLGIPTQCVDLLGVQQAKFKSCWNILVMLYFLDSLSKTDLSIDFQHPIDNVLATFLQSNESVRVLEMAGAIKLTTVRACANILLQEPPMRRD